MLAFVWPWFTGVLRRGDMQLFRWLGVYLRGRGEGLPLYLRHPAVGVGVSPNLRRRAQPADEYQAVPARLTPFKQSQHFFAHRRVEIVGDLDLPFSKPRCFFRTGALIGLNRAIGLPALAMMIFRTGRNLIDQRDR